MTTTPTWGVGLLSGRYSTAFTPCARPVMYSGWLWAWAWGLPSAAATPSVSPMHMALMSDSSLFAPDARYATGRFGRVEKGRTKATLRSYRRHLVIGAADRRSRGR